MYQLDLALPYLPKSLNKALRFNCSGSNRLNKGWDDAIWVAVRGQLPPKPLQKARIRLVRHFWQTLDYDGLVGSMKPVVDALVTAGVLIDDRWSVTGPWEVTQVFRPKKDGPMLEIQVTEA